eukprot:5968115-Amphidinium_carterae.1
MMSRWSDFSLMTRPRTRLSSSCGSCTTIQTSPLYSKDWRCRLWSVLHALSADPCMALKQSYPCNWLRAPRNTP